MTRRDPMLRSVERHERQEMASTVTFKRPGEASVDSAGDVSYQGVTVYSGSATVAREDAVAQTLTFGGAPQTITRYLVTVPRGSGIEEGDVGKVDASPDPTLEGVVLRVVDASGSDWSASKNLVCGVA